jgi:hypothetical protein
MRMRGIGVSGRKGDPADPGKPALAAGDMVRAHFVSRKDTTLILTKIR